MLPALGHADGGWHKEVNAGSDDVGDGR